MANTKGTRRENVIVPMLGTEPLSAPIHVRFEPAVYRQLRAKGREMQRFVRDAVAEKLEREACSFGDTARVALQQEN